MIEIKNNTRSPISLMVKSKKAVRAFTTIIVPGIGSGKNIYLLEDERYTPNIDDIKNKNLISVRKVN